MKASLKAPTPLKGQINLPVARNICQHDHAEGDQQHEVRGSV
jgi:hypothetical protein